MNVIILVKLCQKITVIILDSWWWVTTQVSSLPCLSYCFGCCNVLSPCRHQTYLEGILSRWNFFCSIPVKTRVKMNIFWYIDFLSVWNQLGDTCLSPLATQTQAQQHTICMKFTLKKLSRAWGTCTQGVTYVSTKFYETRFLKLWDILKIYSWNLCIVEWLTKDFFVQRFPFFPDIRQHLHFLEEWDKCKWKQ